MQEFAEIALTQTSHAEKSRNLPTRPSVQAVALLAEMPTRRVKPDVVCFGAAIAALAEVAGTQNRSSWGRKSAPEQHSHGDGELEVVPLDDVRARVHGDCLT